MGKKTFTDSPAMQFISTPTAPQENTERPASAAIPPTATGATFEALPDIQPEARTRGFYTVEKPLIRRAKEGQEPRSRRMQLLFRPSVFVEIRNIAAKKRVSFNHMVEAILTAYLEQYHASEAQETTGAGEDARKR